MVLKDWTAESEAKAVEMHSAATVVHIECALGVGRTSVLCEVALGQGGEPKGKGKGKYKSAMEFAIGAAPPADDHAKYYEQAQARLEHQRAARFGVPWAGPGGGGRAPKSGHLLSPNETLDLACRGLVLGGRVGHHAPFFDVEQLRPPYGQSGEAVIPR